MKPAKNDPFSPFLDPLSNLESALRRAASDLRSQWSRSNDRMEDLDLLRLPSSNRSSKPQVPLILPIASLLGRRNRRNGDDGRVDEDCSCAHQNLSLDAAFSSVKRSFKKCSQNASDPKHLKGSKRKGADLFQLELLLRGVIDDMVPALGASGENGEEWVTDRLSSKDNGNVELRKRKVWGPRCFLSRMGFARVAWAAENTTMDAGGAECGRVGEGGEEGDGNKEEAQKVTGGLLNLPSNVERWRSMISNFSLTELVEFFRTSSSEHPDKKRLIAVQDFFRYTEAEGRRFFEELDRDGDGQVTLEDVEAAIRKRNLPRRYARDFFRCTRRHMFSKSFGWKQFLSLIKQKDPTILQAYTTLCLSKSGTLQKNQILATLEDAGLPVNEENAIAMLRYLIADTNGSISYSHFRNFMLLLPSKRLKEDPRSIWFEAATVVAVPPPVEIPAENVLKSALAGGLASALSTSLLYPVDTMKTRVQVSSLALSELVSQIPHIGLNGLYRGCIPAIVGQFSSHGLRTGIFEASKLILTNISPTLPDIQVQSVASFCSTILGTAVRIPCEVLKQRLQAGLFNNVGEAIIGTIHQDGFKGFFRGTGATLCREVPLYVAGMGLYAEAKKVAQNLLRRDLEPWETIAVGALSGGLAAVVTTPFDVMKTRMMTAQGRQVSMKIIALSVLRQEGPIGLFKGAVPRFFWIAPLGAMNFAGYELAKKAMERPDNFSDDVPSEKNISSSD